MVGSPAARVGVKFDPWGLALESPCANTRSQGKNQIWSQRLALGSQWARAGNTGAMVGITFNLSSWRGGKPEARVGGPEARVGSAGARAQSLETRMGNTIAHPTGEALNTHPEPLGTTWPSVACETSMGPCKNLRASQSDSDRQSFHSPSRGSSGHMP